MLQHYTCTPWTFLHAWSLKITILLSFVIILQQIIYFAALPPSPFNLMLSTMNNIATVQWSHPNIDQDVSITSYLITISPAPGDGTCSGGTCSVSAALICPMSSPTCSYSITHLQYDQTYTVTVRSVNCRGSSSIVPLQFIIQNSPTTGMLTICTIIIIIPLFLHTL